MGWKLTHSPSSRVFCVSVAAPPASNSEDRSRHEKDLDASKKDEVLLNVIRPDYERPLAPPPMKPLFDLADDGKVCGKRLKKLTIWNHFFQVLSLIT